MHHTTNLALLAALIALAVSCSGEPSLDDAGIGDESFGLVAVQFAHELDVKQLEDPGLLEVNTTAQFVRFAAIQRERVARLLALPLHPQVDLPQLDSCRVFEQTTVLSEQEADRESEGYVDLLEAGELAVEAGPQQLTLEPRYFPGLLPFISGVIDGEAQLSGAGQPGRVSARAAGSAAVGAFLAEGTSPDPIVLESAIAPEQPLPGSFDLRLRWKAARAPMAQQAAYFEIFEPQQANERVLRCAVRDDGDFAIDAHLLAEIVGPNSRELALEGGRIRQFSFEARGLNGGELRVSTVGRTTIPLR